MKNNLIEKYELVDGQAVFNSNFRIVTANEAMYRFMGISLEYYLMNVIHQVDMEDFIDVCNCLRLNQQKNMVLRMRRSDNSYRWMLISIKKCVHTFTDPSIQESAEEYFEMHASDIIAMKSQNEELHKTVRNFRHILAMENDLFYTYDYLTKLVSIFHFIDNDIEKIIEEPLNDFYERIIENHMIAADDIEEFGHLCDEIRSGTISYKHKLNISFAVGQELDTFEISGYTIYSEVKPNESVGSIKNISVKKNSSYSYKTIEYANTEHALPYDKVREFCVKNIHYNPECKITLFLVEINDLDSYAKQFGREFASQLCADLVHTAKVQVGYRGTVCSIKENLISIAVKDLSSDIDMRAFVESLRTRLKWEYKLINPYHTLSFSMGISNYPNNGRNLGQINRKLVKALEIAESKHKDCFVIYREHLHGDIE